MAIILLSALAYFVAAEAVNRSMPFDPQKKLLAAGFVFATGIGTAIILMWLWPSQLKK
jgi:hypothetical protein